MYGLAGHRYTPGMPHLSALDVKERRPKTSGVAGPRTSNKRAGMGSRGSASAYKDGKYKKVQYGEA